MLDRQPEGCYNGFNIKNLRKRPTLEDLRAVTVPAHLLEKIQDYASKKKVPFSECVEEALTDWLTCVAPARLQEKAQPPKLAQIFEMPVRA